MVINDLLKNLRDEKKLTLKEIANSIGVSVSYMSYIENKDRMPSLETLYKLSIIYQYPVDKMVEILCEHKRDLYYKQCIIKLKKYKYQNKEK